jgi:Glutamate/Leucine/Phenylalanine/Valine dehydrogenase
MALRSSPSRARNPADRRQQCDSDHLGLWQCWLARRAGSREQGRQDHWNRRSHDRFLRSEGLRDSSGDRARAKHRALKGRADQATIDAVELLTRRCDILVPCAVERVIDAEVAAKPQCPVIAESANGPTTPEADLALAQRNDQIFVIPDILCNARGVIVSYFEGFKVFRNTSGQRTR